jgi:hypothetical protein
MHVYTMIEVDTKTGGRGEERRGEGKGGGRRGERESQSMTTS